MPHIPAQANLIEPHNDDVDVDLPQEMQAIPPENNPWEFHEGKRATNRPSEILFSDLLYKIYTYPPLHHLDDQVLKALKNNKGILAFNKAPVLPTAYLGIEVEVEGIAKPHPNLFNDISPIWVPKEDGSLRNSGLEFVTIPIRASAALPALELLEKKLMQHNKGYVFSDRTSIHVHLNVRRLSIEQLACYLLVYVMCEKVLYNYVDTCGVSRSTNIFCTPIVESGGWLPMHDLFRFVSTKQYDHIPVFLVQLWKKYSGLNLKRLNDLGTLEFRQMSGTLDLNVLNIWINLILSIKKYIHTHNYENILHTIENINTVSNYMQFLEDVFGEYAKVLFNTYHPEDIEECVTNLKVSIAVAESENREKPTKESLTSSSMYRYLIKEGLIRFADKEIEVLEKKRRILMEQYEIYYKILLSTPKMDARIDLKRQLLDIDCKITEIANEIKELQGQ